jgi:hypothetical protein
MVTAGCLSVDAKDPSFHFEGVLAFDEDPTFTSILTKTISAFLPYNPTVVVINGHSGEEAVLLAQRFPKGHVLVFEPNPNSFNNLRIHAGSLPNLLPFCEDLLASLFYTTNNRLDYWLQTRDVHQIDFIRLDADGLELSLLRSPPSIIKTAAMIFTKTNPDSKKDKVHSFHKLKHYMQLSGFCLLSHWYREGCRGEALFIRKDIYNAIYQ